MLNIFYLRGIIPIFMKVQYANWKKPKFRGDRSVPIWEGSQTSVAVRLRVYYSGFYTLWTIYQYLT